ncbi:MAG: TPM domain-containing protein [Bacilli bacterium]|nr:TPM domain-containing protein [Bacilli bacterium]
MKKILLTIIFFFILITPIKANEFETYERTESNNYGVNKKWKITDSNKDNVLRTPYVDSSVKVYDFQESLTEEEVEQLQERIEEFTDKTGFDLAIVITSFPFNCYGNDCGTTNEDYAADFYDYNDFGLEQDDEYYNGVIIVRNEFLVDGLGYMQILYFGEAQLYYTESPHDAIYHSGAPYMTKKEYSTGFNNMIDKLEYYYKQGKDKNLALDPNGHVYDTRKQKLDKNGNIVNKWNPPLGLAFIIAAIVTPIRVAILKGKNKMVHKAFTAQSFLNQNSINYTKRDNILTNTIVTHHHIDTSSGGGGGGGGGFHSSGSSGGGHSGGGGRC